MRPLFSTAAILLMVAGVAAGCSDTIEPGNTSLGKGPVVTVPVMVAEEKVQPQIYEAVGTVTARVAATVSSKLMGTVLSVAVREGDRVKQGDLLVTLDDRQVAAQLAQAQAVLQAARKGEAEALSARAAAAAGAEQALLAYRRSQTLLAGEAITRADFEGAEARQRQSQAALKQAEAAVQAAQSRVQQARAAVDAAQVARQDARVEAPFEGRVTAKLVDAGDLAAPGKPLIVMERIGGYRVDLEVPESYAHLVRTGQPVAVRVPSAGPAVLQGTVAVVVPAADPRSRTSMVQVEVPGTETLRSGMFARADLIVAERPLMRIPVAAVVQKGQLSGVFIVDQDDTARFRLIRTGRSDGDQVDVISGLAPGTRLVAAPPVQLANGSAVEAEK
jgi:multidrug efflux pump subunit AcrA (membrane-fusion protein)